MRFAWLHRKPWVYPTVILTIVPLVVFLLWVFGPNDTDSFALFANLAVEQNPGQLGGASGVEPNEGFTSYALGYRATHDLFSGHWPLWNSYEGLGAPLLGEMQSAALFPFTWLIPLPTGQILEHTLLQFFAGVGAYLFFRRFGLDATAALAGGVAWEVNGVFAWLRNAIFNPAALLPWLFFATEVMREHACNERPFKQRLQAVCLCAVAGAMALYAGFPEEVYLYSLLLALWVFFRFAGLEPKQIRLFALDLILAGILALSLSAPLLVAFMDFLREADIGRHAGNGYYGLYPHYAILLLYLMPYIFGPLYTYSLPDIWGAVGGYLGLTPLLLGIATLASPRRRPVKVFLAIGIVVAVGISIGVPGLYDVFMTLPLAKITEPSRYLNAGWTFCAIFLAVLFISESTDLTTATLRRRTDSGVIVAIVALAAAVLSARPLLTQFAATSSANQHTLEAALASAILIAAVVIAVPRVVAGTRVGTVFSVILVTEGLGWFLVPYLSYPRHTVLDYGPIRFLQNNVGLQRVMMYAGQGLSPNYGSMFGIPMLNYNDLPVPARTVAYIKRRLDPYPSDVFLLGHPELAPEDQKARLALFRARLPAYADAGVKYLVATETLNEELAAEDRPPLKAVFKGRNTTVYELPSPRAYFSADGCAVHPLSHTRVEVACERPSRLIRLEVQLRGWSAKINGAPSQMSLEDETFQALDIPAGRSVVTFRYWPPGFSVALLAAAAGSLLMIAIAATAMMSRKRVVRQP